MKFYSGFSLKNESHYFNEFSDSSEYTVSGFSYGAIKAFEYAKEQLEQGNRADRLKLYSPAFFQTKSEKFKRLQTLSYSKNKDTYMKMFIKSCFSPYDIKTLEYSDTSINDLEKLLEYEWSLSELVALEMKGTKIEVYLGSEDKVIDVVNAREFFLQVATVTYIKNANHFLEIK